MNIKQKTVMVKAADGLKMIAPMGHAINHPGNYITADTPVEMIWSSYVRKRIKAGDFVLVDGADYSSADEDQTIDESESDNVTAE